MKHDSGPQRPGPLERERYLERLERAPVREVALGGRGVRLFGADELDDAQLGYSVSPSGQRLWGERRGEWRQSWLVIGEDDEHGDPIFVDLADPALAVHTAIAGEGVWEPLCIASQCERFFALLALWHELGAGRATAEEWADDPLPPWRHAELPARLRSIDPELEPRYWLDWLEGLAAH